MTSNLELEKLAIDHANHVSDPEWECWHKRQGSFKSGYTRAINDVVGWLVEQKCICSGATDCEFCYSNYLALAIENKFLRGEK